MDVQRMPTRQIVAQLPDRLEKRQAFDIADRAADLAQNEIKAFVAFPDEILDGVGDVRDHLNRCAKIIAAALARKNILIDPSRRDVVVPCGGAPSEALVVSDIEIGL